MSERIELAQSQTSCIPGVAKGLLRPKMVKPIGDSLVDLPTLSEWPVTAVHQALQLQAIA